MGLIATVAIGNKVVEAANPEGIVQTDGTKLVYPDGTEYDIRGISFANQVYDNPSSVTKTHHDENAYKILSEMGFNSIRFYINYGIFEDDENPYEYKEEGFAWIDKNIEQADKYGIKLILNMHYPQGGYQSTGTGIELWTDIENQKRLIALWSEIARRYEDCDTILGYGLVNEPIVAKTDINLKGVDIWKDLAQRITDGIRIYDENHIVFIENIYGSQIYDENKGEWIKDKNDKDSWTLIDDDNVVYEFHFYNPLEVTHMHIYGDEINKDATYKLDAKTMEAMVYYALKWGEDNNVPLFMGEFGTSKISYENNALGEQWMEAMMHIIYKYDINFSYHNFHERNFGLYTTSSSVAYDNLNKRLYDILMEYFELVNNEEPKVEEPEVEEPKVEEPEIEEPKEEEPEIEEPKEEEPEIEEPKEEEPEVEEPKEEEHEHKLITTIVTATTYRKGSILQACEGCGEVFYYTDVARIKGMKLSASSFKYTGSEIKPEVVVTDKYGNVIASKYYTVTYYNNVNAGSGTVQVVFHKYYEGTLRSTFTIKPSFSFSNKGKSLWNDITSSYKSNKKEKANVNNVAIEKNTNEINLKNVIETVIVTVKNKINKIKIKTLQ